MKPTPGYTNLAQPAMDKEDPQVPAKENKLHTTAEDKEIAIQNNDSV